MHSKLSDFVSVLALVSAISVPACGAASAATVTVDFPAGGTSYYSFENGSGTIPTGGQSDFLWTTGDYVTQTFTGIGLASITSIAATFQIQNFLGSADGTTPSNLAVDVVINGTTVGSFTAFDDNLNGDIQTLSFNLGLFAQIDGGGTYTLAFVLQNTAPFGGGSIAFLDGGTATLSGDALTATPLPAALPLFASGLGALGLISWRRKRKASAPIAS